MRTRFVGISFYVKINRTVPVSPPTDVSFGPELFVRETYSFMCIFSDGKTNGVFVSVVGKFRVAVFKVRFKIYIFKTNDEYLWTTREGWRDGDRDSASAKSRWQITVFEKRYEFAKKRTCACIYTRKSNSLHRKWRDIQICVIRFENNSNSSILCATRSR